VQRRFQPEEQSEHHGLLHSQGLRPAALPTVEGCRLHAAGFDWDAIRVPRGIGVHVLAILGSRSGAVIEDPREPALYWFVGKGSTAGWDVPDTRPLGVTQHLVVPPLHRVEGPGPHWRICPSDSGLITDMQALRNAIQAVIGPPRTSRYETS
jgi:hypothetical protein